METYPAGNFTAGVDGEIKRGAGRANWLIATQARAFFGVLAIVFTGAAEISAQISTGGDVSPSNPTNPSWEPSSLTVGFSSDGSLAIQSGGSVVTGSLNVGYFTSGAIGTIGMNGGRLFVSGSMSLGAQGQGIVQMTNDSVTTVGNALTVGGFGTADSSVTMEASTLDVGYTISVGGYGNSTATLTSGSSLTSASGVSDIYGVGTSEGKVTVEDSTFETFSLQVGRIGKGKLVLEDDAVVSVTTGLVIGRNLGSQGRVEVDSSELMVGDLLQVGGTGTGVLEISSGGSVSAKNVLVAYGGNGAGQLLLDGGTLSVTEALEVSSGGNGASGGIGHFIIQNGGQATSQTGRVGYAQGRSPQQQGSAEIFAGSWTMSGEFSIETTLLIHTGGSVTNTDGRIASWSGTDNGLQVTVTVDGGTWTNTGSLIVGSAQPGLSDYSVLNVSNHGVVANTIGRMALIAGGEAFARIDGGTWTNTTSLTVGEYGQATLTAANGGIVDVAAGTGLITLGKEAQGTGTLNLGAYDLTDTAGTINAAEVRGGSGVSRVNFNQTDAANFTAIISGNVDVTQRGSGVTTLSAASTYTGDTRVIAGTLKLAPSATLNATSSITVSSGAIFDVRGANFNLGATQTLSGSGSILGDVTIAGTLAPGASPGLLTFEGDLSLGSSANTLIELGGTLRGTNYDSVHVTGNLVYGGTLMISLINGFAALPDQPFQLFSATGSMSGLFSSVSLSEVGYVANFNPASGVLTISAIPEPAECALLVGLAGLGLLAWRRRRAIRCVKT